MNDCYCQGIKLEGIIEHVWYLNKEGSLSSDLITMNTKDVS